MIVQPVTSVMTKELMNNLGKQRLQTYISQETYQQILALWYARRSKDRKTTLSDIVEQAVKEYATREKTEQ